MIATTNRRGFAGQNVIMVHTRINSYTPLALNNGDEIKVDGDTTLSTKNFDPISRTFMSYFSKARITGREGKWGVVIKGCDLHMKRPRG